MMSVSHDGGGRQAAELLQVIGDAAGVVAVIKPAGLPTQAPAGIDSAEGRMRRMLAPLPAGGGAYLGVPHRLDRAVSGVLLFAVTPRAARKLARQFERREVRKTYRAVVAPLAGAAVPPGAECHPAEWRDWVEKVPDEPRCRRTEPDGSAGSREAVTLARSLGASALHAGHLLVELEPLTGRMHQLRLQAACRGLPIVGDELYGGPAGLGGTLAADPRARPIGLHAWRIEYTDPDAGTRIVREAPLPHWWPGTATPPS